MEIIKNSSMENIKPQKKDVAKAVVWKIIEKIGVNGITFIISLVLARLLMPEDYGVLALLNIFIQVSTSIIDGGFSSSLIQKNNCNQNDLCSVFWFSFIFSIICYLFLFIIAPFISRFYNQQILIPVLRVIAITLIIRVFQCIPVVLVNKNINFKITARTAFISNISSGVVAIILAYKGFGVWALVIQQVCSTLISTILYIYFTKWIPKFLFSFSALKNLFNFGSKMMLLVFSSAIFDNVYGIVIGKKFNSSALGIYNRGEQFPRLIVSNVSGAMENVIFPTLSYYTEDKEKALSIVRRFIMLSTYFVMPLMFGLIAVAKPMVLFLLTDKWIESVFFLRVACIVWALDPLKGASFSTMYAFGKSDLALKITLLRYAIVMSSLIISVNFGLKAMAIGFAIAMIITKFFDLYPLTKLLDYRWSEIAKDILPSIAMSIIMFLIVWIISFIDISIGLQLIIQIITGIIIYIILSFILKNKSFYYIMNNAKFVFNRRKNV